MPGFFYDGDSTKLGEWPAFSAFASAVALANNKSLLSIVNTSSTNLVRIRELWIENDQTAAITGVIAQLNLLRITGHSNGTSITVCLNDTTETLDSGVSVRTGSTVSGEDSVVCRQWKVSTDEWGVGAQDVESLQQVFQQAMPRYSGSFNSRPITLRQNQGITVKNITNTTAGTFNLFLVFTVEPV